MTRQAWLVAKRELRGFFDQPTAYVLAVAFLGLGLYLAFRSLYAMSAATLRPFFDVLPWLLVVFVPAVAMKSLAEERRSRTLEWLRSQPMNETEIVLGKFLGNWLFVLITLTGTLPMAVGVLLVSEADPGIMATQYLGAALLTAQMIAIGIWASALARNQITAFIIGAFTCFALVLIGTPIVQIGLPRLVGGWAAQLSVISHFENVARGVVDLRDVLYFASTSGLFLLLATGALGQARLSRAGAERRRLRIGTGVVAVAVLLLNLLAGHVRGRLDLTRGDLFTLSEGSRDILAQLDDVVALTLVVSDDLPQEIQLAERDVRDLVADLENAANGMVTVREINPDDDEELAQEASSLGVVPIEFNVLRSDALEVRRGYFGVALAYADEQETIAAVNRTDDLEYRLVSSIAKMTRTDRPTVAFMSGFEAKDAFHYQAFRQSVADRYDVIAFDVANDSTGALQPDSVDVLVVAAPAREVSGAALASVDHYLNAGGAALLLLERHALNPQAPMVNPVTTGLEPLLQDRGVAATGDLAFDLSAAERVSVPQGVFTVIRPYPYWPIAQGGGDHATIRDLGNVTFGWAAPFTWDEDDPTVTPLWITTEAGGARPPGGMIAPSMDIPVAEDELGVRTLAVAIDPSLAEGEEDDASTGGGRVVAVGDGDFLEDRFAQANPQNLAFAANAIDWLAQDEALISIRSKDRTPPALTFQSDAGRNVLKWTSLIGVPAFLIVFGFVRVTGRTARAKRRWHGSLAEEGAS